MKSKVTQGKSEPVVLMSHPTGNENVRNALRSLVERDMLAEFWTTIAWNADSRWNRLLPAGVRAQLARRAFPEAPAHQVRCVPWRETVRLAARSGRSAKSLCSGERPFSVIGMYRNFDERVARRLGALRPNIVYAYEGGALRSFREAKRLGLVTCYELPSGFWYWERKLLSEEAQSNPEFAGLHPKLEDSPGHMQWKDEELALADYVFVPSRHVRNTLLEIVPEEKIRVISYGAPPVGAEKRVSLDRNRPLKVLFVGALIQRKGIGYLLEAIEKLGSQVELTLVGRRFSANPRVDEACRRWRWFETLTHAQVMELMQQSDVLVLPSLSEAFGLVVTEALACGLPVIVTANAGSSEFVRDGREGFIVPICRADAIADRLTELNENRDLLAEMSRQAQKSAAARSWETYRAEWADALKGLSCR